MITGINRSRTLTKHISCKCDCKLIVKNVTQIKSRITISVESVKIQKNMYVKKVIFLVVQHLATQMLYM